MLLLLLRIGGCGGGGGSGAPIPHLNAKAFYHEGTKNTERKTQLQNRTKGL